jgi:flagellar hook-basal body complex protein FliE
MLDAITAASGLNSALKVAQQGLQNSSPAMNFASSMIDVVKQAESVATAGMQGQVPMQDVVMKVMEAERTFATAMAIRDKAVGAYLEISRMQI